MRNYIEEFSQAMLSQGITPPRNIIATGKIERFSSIGKPAQKNGWYVLFVFPIPAGAFGDWRTGVVHTWCSKSKDQMAPHEWLAHKNLIADARLKNEHAKDQRHQHAAVRAVKLWNHARPINPQHPYLCKKRILPFIARQIGNSLVLPLTDFKGQLSSLQFIQPDGAKRLLSGGAKISRFIQVTSPPYWSRLLICEGFATGATLAQSYPETSVIAAIDAGNLKAVAIGARAHWSDSEIIICADDDRFSKENIGISKGLSAALAARALFTRPRWPTDAPKELSDFNDLACWLANESKGAL